jgi:hypothetical protein
MLTVQFIPRSACSKAGDKFGGVDAALERQVTSARSRPRTTCGICCLGVPIAVDVSATSEPGEPDENLYLKNLISALRRQIEAVYLHSTMGSTGPIFLSVQHFLYHRL